MADPKATPLTMPEELPTEAMAVLLLAQVPPGLVLVSGVDEPRHTMEYPLTVPAEEDITVSVVVV